MTEDELFQATGDAFQHLIHPAMNDGAWRRSVAPVIDIAPAVPAERIATLIVGASWRERLLGYCIAVVNHLPSFQELIHQALRDPRGIAIVPACAALAVLAQRGAFKVSPSFGSGLDRSAFDGEVGWAVDKAMHAVGLRPEAVLGRGPNYCQVFEDHVGVYEWMHEVRGMGGPLDSTAFPGPRSATIPGG